MLEGLFGSKPNRYYSKKNSRKNNIYTWLIAIVVFIGLAGWSSISKSCNRRSDDAVRSSAPAETSESVATTTVIEDNTPTSASLSATLDENEFAYQDAINICSGFSLDGLYEPVIVNNNIPTFSDNEIYENSLEYYSPLDDKGRAVFAFSCIGQDLMPTEDRPEEISIDPSGWHSVPADNVENGWLYNRCHLIAYCLTAEGDNECNFVTGTRNMNVNGMLPYEEAVAEVLDDNPGIHIMYRVTPIFIGDNLVCNGVLMEGYSVEDNGQLVCFCVFCPNTQPDWIIHYDTGYADPV